MLNNPYMNQYQQFNQEQQRINNPYLRGFPQPTGLPGKYINNLQEVVVSEVPQDGSVAFFPTTDFLKIYAKAWTADGKIHTEEYSIVKSNQEKPAVENQILSKLEKIEEMLMPKKTSRKKEVDSDD